MLCSQYAGVRYTLRRLIRTWPRSIRPRRAQHHHVPLWGTEDHEFITDASFADLYERKRRTTNDEIERSFLPTFRAFLQAVNGDADPAAFGQLLVRMEDFFARADYSSTMKSRPVWNAFTEEMLAFSVRAAGALPAGAREQQKPTLFSSHRMSALAYEPDRAPRGTPE